MENNELKKLCNLVIEENPDKVKDYKSGKVTLLGLFVGEAMIKSRGTADPKELNKTMNELLNK